MAHQAVSGVIAVDKPEGISSARLVARLKRCLGGMKVGHTGTLDPFATGVMVCCINRATKLARFFLTGEKTYRAVLCLGIATDTQDITGSIIKTGDITQISEAAVLRTMGQFKGEILQTPPVYSALKHKGTPLYKLARSGNPVCKPPRRIHIAALDIEKMALPEVHFSVTCSAGTYIRTICADIGHELGCGAYLKALRRVESCGFKISESIRLEEVENIMAASGDLSGHIIPMADALRHLPSCVADKKLAANINHGKQLTKQDLQRVHGEIEGPEIKIIDTEKHLLAVLRVDDNVIKYCCVFPR